MPILRNEELRRSWKGKRPSTEKEGEKRSKLPSVHGNHVQPSREPSKRKAAKQPDPNFAYYERISKKKKGVVKQPSQSDKGLLDHSSKKTKNRVDRQQLQHASQSDKGSADRSSGKTKKSVVKQPVQQPYKSGKGLSDCSSGTPKALKAVHKLIDARKKNNLPPNMVLEGFKAKVLKNAANYNNEERQPTSPIRDEELVDNPRTGPIDNARFEEDARGYNDAPDGDEPSDADDEDVQRGAEEDAEGRSEEEDDPDGESEEEDPNDESEEEEDSDDESEEEDHENKGPMEGGDEVSDEGDESGDEESDEGEAQQVKKKKGRGEAKMAANLPFEDRPKLYVIGERAFRSKPFDSKVVSTIAQLVKRNAKGPYATYGAFPKDTQREILRAFLMKYRWGKPKERDRCCEVFHRIARCRYSNILTKVRDDVAKMADSSDPRSWKPFPPSWFRPKYWKELCDYWSSPEWQKKSSTMRKNRIKSGVHVYHRQGRSNCYTLSRKMGEKLKRNVTYAEVYVKTRMQKDKKEFLTVRANTTWDNYCKMMAEKYGEDSDEWPLLDTEIWFHASGGKKNGCFYGMPAVMDSTKLPGARSKYPVMDNILSNGSNSANAQLASSSGSVQDYYGDDDDEDEVDDPDYVPRRKKSKTSATPSSKKVRKNVFDDPNFSEDSFDLDGSISSDSSYEDDGHDGDDMDVSS